MALTTGWLRERNRTDREGFATLSRGEVLVRVEASSTVEGLIYFEACN